MMSVTYSHGLEMFPLASALIIMTVLLPDLSSDTTTGKLVLHAGLLLHAIKLAEGELLDTVHSVQKAENRSRL